MAYIFTHTTLTQGWRLTNERGSNMDTIPDMELVLQWHTLIFMQESHHLRIPWFEVCISKPILNFHSVLSFNTLSSFKCKVEILLYKYTHNEYLSHSINSRTKNYTQNSNLKQDCTWNISGYTRDTAVSTSWNILHFQFTLCIPQSDYSHIACYYKILCSLLPWHNQTSAS